jgi:hypothetical protein
VKPGRALGDETLGGRDRVTTLDSDVFATPFGEADDASVEHVEGGIDREVLVR